MRTQSAKAKGRRLQQWIRDKILETFPLRKGDVESRSMGASGTDVMLSPAARDYFKFAVECKNVERLNIWSAWEQAVANSKKEGDPPLLVIKRNHQVPLVVMEAKDFFELLRGKNET